MEQYIIEWFGKFAKSLYELYRGRTIADDQKTYIFFKATNVPALKVCSKCTKYSKTKSLFSFL